MMKLFCRDLSQPLIDGMQEVCAEDVRVNPAFREPDPFDTVKELLGSGRGRIKREFELTHQTTQQCFTKLVKLRPEAGDRWVEMAGILSEIRGQDYELTRLAERVDRILDRAVELLDRVKKETPKS